MYRYIVIADRKKTIHRNSYSPKPKEYAEAGLIKMYKAYLPAEDALDPVWRLGS